MKNADQWSNFEHTKRPFVVLKPIGKRQQNKSNNHHKINLQFENKKYERAFLYRPNKPIKYSLQNNVL
jgi:hypothetical protein